MNLPSVPTEALLSLCRKVSRVIKTLVAIGQEAELKSHSILAHLVTKLPRHKQERWGAIEYDLSQHHPPRVADINDLKAFLDRTAGTEETMFFQPGVHLSTREKKTVRVSSKPVKIPSPRTPPTTPPPQLRRDHVIESCPSKRSCFVEGYSGRPKHHTLLHGADIFANQLPITPSTSHLDSVRRDTPHNIYTSA